MAMRALAVSSVRGRSAIVVLVVALTLLVGGSAVAYWARAGSGSAAGTTATTTALTLSPATPTAQLYPGGQTTVVLTVNNPNSLASGSAPWPWTPGRAPTASRWTARTRRAACLPSP